MADYILIIPLLASFLITLLILPSWIKRAMNAGLYGKDMNKFDKGEVAEGGGITVITGFILGILSYIAIKTFYFQSSDNLIEIFALVSAILIVAFIGMMDYLLGWKIGLGKKLRIFLVVIAAIPLMVINVGESFISLPIIGRFYIGLLYPLLAVPIGITGAATTFNFLAGYNGLEARQGILILGALAVATWFSGYSWITLILLCMIAALTAFLVYNWYPAKVFPGDILTYSVGALIACAAILGNLERFAVFIFIPNIIEVFLKLRGRLVVESFGNPKKDGSLELRNNKICGLEHLAIRLLQKFRGKAYENDVVLVINLFQIAVIILGFIIFKQGIFYGV